MTVPTLGRPHRHLRRAGSTNDVARALAGAGAPHGTLVTAAEQTAGRGRQGRTWSAPAGRSLLMSLVLREPPPLLPLLAAVAVAEVAGPRARIKWPNDVLLDTGKVAGILVEARPQQGWAVLGIGLNVAVELGELPGELRSTAATLGLPAADIPRVRDGLLDAIARGLARSAPETLDAWRSRDALVGEEVEWSAGRGRCLGIDGAGRLVVELAAGGRTELEAGEVHLARG